MVMECTIALMVIVPSEGMATVSNGVITLTGVEKWTASLLPKA